MSKTVKHEISNAKVSRKLPITKTFWKKLKKNNTIKEIWQFQ
jgi:hypothetical protein